MYQMDDDDDATVAIQHDHLQQYPCVKYIHVYKLAFLSVLFIIIPGVFLDNRIDVYILYHTTYNV